MTCLMLQISQPDDQTSSTPAAAEAPVVDDHAEQSQDPARVEPEASYQHDEVVQAVEQAAASTSGMTTDSAAWHACPSAQLAPHVRSTALRRRLCASTAHHGTQL
jgi:hypothetical protein